MFQFVNWLKAFATIFITNSHYGEIWPISAMAMGGHLGNCLFFMLSGFCMYNIRESFPRWYAKRILRIYPALWIVATVDFLVGRNSAHGIMAYIHCYIWPTWYHFISSIMLLYVGFYIVRWIHKKWNIGTGWFLGGLAFAFLVLYVTVFDRSYFHIDDIAEDWVRFQFFASMLVGILLRERYEKIEDKLTVWHSVRVLGLFVGYFLLKLLIAVFPETRTFEEMVSMFLPILRGRYWFFTAYVVVMLLSPVLNLVIRSLKKGQFHLLLAVLFFLFGVIPVGALGYDVMRIDTGHHFSWMIVLYIIGGYMRRFVRDEETNKTHWLLGYFAFALIHLLYKYVVIAVGLTGFADLLLTYPSPLVVGESICLFLFFRDMGTKIDTDGITGKLIQFAVPGVYSVYVIHVHPKVYWNADIIALFRAWDGWNILTVCAAMVGTAAVLFTACICLDAVRQWLFRVLGIDRTIGKVSGKIEMRIRTLLGE